MEYELGLGRVFIPGTWMTEVLEPPVRVLRRKNYEESTVGERYRESETTSSQPPLSVFPTPDAPSHSCSPEETVDRGFESLTVDSTRTVCTTVA